MLASLHQLAKQNILETGQSFLQDCKKVSISISFQTRVEIFPQYSISEGVGERMFWVEKMEKLISERGRLLGTQE